MAQEKIDIPVSQIPQSMFAQIIEGSKNGVCELNGDYISTYRFMEEVAHDAIGYAPELKVVAAMFANAAIAFAGATITGFGLVAAPFAAAVSFVMTPFFGNNRIMTIMIGNGLDKELQLTANGVYQAHGVQTGAPIYNEIIPGTTTFNDKTKNLIPGKISPAPTLDMYGLGLYRFEKDLDLGIGFRGTMGAISFSTTDPELKNKTIAIAWMLGQDDTVGCAVTLDLAQYGTLKDFYEKTAGAGKQVRVDHSGNVIIHGTLGIRTYDEDHFAELQVDDMRKSAPIIAGMDLDLIHKLYNNVELTKMYMKKHKKALFEDLLLTVTIRK